MPGSSAEAPEGDADGARALAQQRVRVAVDAGAVETEGAVGRGYLVGTALFLPTIVSLATGGGSAALLIAKDAPRLLCRCALRLSSAPRRQALTSAQASCDELTLAARCAWGLRALLYFVPDAKVALQLAPYLAAACRRAARVPGTRLPLQINAIGLVARSWCASTSAVAALPPEAMASVVQGLAPPR